LGRLGIPQKDWLIFPPETPGLPRRIPLGPVHSLGREPVPGSGGPGEGGWAVDWVKGRRGLNPLSVGRPEVGSPSERGFGPGPPGAFTIPAGRTEGGPGVGPERRVGIGPDEEKGILPGGSPRKGEPGAGHPD